MGEHQEAVDMAKKAIEVARKKLDALDDPDVRQDADTIIELLIDNIKNWEDEIEDNKKDNEVKAGSQSVGKNSPAKADR